MTKNMGGVDRIVRAAAGIGLMGWAIMGGPFWAWIGVIPLLTAGIGVCPAYLPFGFSTCAAKKTK